MSGPTGAPVTIVGAGRVGTAFAACLRRRRTPRLVAVVTRDAAKARRVSRMAGRPVGTLDLAGAVDRGTLILLCVPDDAITIAARRLAPLRLKGKSVLHTSGVLPSSALAGLRASGATVGALHPLASFPPVNWTDPHRLEGIAFAFDGDPAARRKARALVAAVGGSFFALSPEDRAAYHLAAVLLSNDLVALLDLGLDLASRRLSMNRARVRRLFMPLILSSIENVTRLGTTRALTGPAARGDAETLRRHLETLAGEAPELASIYRLLSRRAVDMARADGRLDDATAASISHLLSGRDD